MQLGSCFGVTYSWQSVLKKSYSFPAELYGSRVGQDWVMLPSYSPIQVSGVDADMYATILYDGNHGFTQSVGSLTLVM